jgi:hypothetical protein
VIVCASLVLIVGVGLFAQEQFGQRGGSGRNRRPQLEGTIQGNTEYDGRFVFVRVKYGTGGFGRRGMPPWSHDYPDGEVHFSRILEEITLLNLRTDGSNILALDDPELFNYPIAYMAEPGFWVPGLRWVELDGTAAIFHSFFEIPEPLTLNPPYGGLPPSYWGIYENNDPKKRLIAIANVNNDISEYWEFSGTGYAPVDVTNEAYKFGVNFFIYGVVH